MKGSIFLQDSRVNQRRIKISFIVCLIISVCFTASCYAQDEETEYSYTEYSLGRNEVSLHLDCVSMYGTKPDHNILLVHGSTYSSHEFDIDYKDCSLVRRLAHEGYFSHNTWDSAAEDFQRNDDGSFKTDITDPLLIELFCSSCWHYDGDSSPNGWSRDAFVSPTTRLIQLDRITVPTLLIYGDADPNLDYEQLSHALDILPEDSERCIIEGGSHIVM